MNKLINKISLALCAAVLLAACDINRYNPNTPRVFNDKDAFVAFDKTEVSCQEDFEGVVRIPVTLASVAGLEETIPFRIVTPETKAAKEGVNYEILTTSGTLSFNADKRTDYIELNVMPDGEYTGDLKFQIELIETESINLGQASVCTITVVDIDHPLNAILGTYTASSSTGTDFWGNARNPWTMTLIKDENDESKVWFDDIFGIPGWAGSKMLYYGNVTMDGIKPVSISVPLGQESEYLYQGTTPCTLLGFDGEGGYDSGAIDMTFIYGDDGKITLDFGKEYGVWIWISGAGNLIIWNPGTVSAVKN